jgi:ABC-type glycerol-3-phosphate transport system substrate-binding protein
MSRNNQRSIFLVLAFLLIASLAVACGAPAAEAPTEEEAAAPTAAEEEAMGPTSLDFIVWSYGIETIQDNIANFQAANPECEINLQDYSWLDYHETMVGRFAAGDAPPLLYGSDHWLQEWGSAG